MEIRKLMIVGAGGTSRDIAGVVRDANQAQSQWELVGFLDDNPALHGERVDGLPVLGPPEAARESEAQILIGVARAKYPGIRYDIVERLALPRERYATIVHPSAFVSTLAKVGTGTAILQNVVINSQTVVGDHVVIHQNVSMAHDQVVEDFVTIAAGAAINGWVCLRRGCYIGAGSAIRDGITVGEGAVVGMGAVVVRDVPASITVAGNPARELRR